MMRRKSTTESIGIVPPKVAANPPSAWCYVRDHEELAKYARATAKLCGESEYAKGARDAMNEMAEKLEYLAATPNPVRAEQPEPLWRERLPGLLDARGAEGILAKLPAPIREPDYWPPNYASGWNDCARIALDEMTAALQSQPVAAAEQGEMCKHLRPAKDCLVCEFCDGPQPEARGVEGMVPVSEEEEAAIDRAAGLVKITMRLPTALADHLNDEAAAQGLVFPAYVRKLLAAAPAAPGVRVDEAMANRFMRFFNCEAESTTGTRLYTTEQANVLNALTAALAPDGGEGE